jgi:superfamily II DNA or RNA helicase
MDIVVNGEFIGKTKKYTDGIIQLKLDDFLTGDQKNYNALKKMSENDKVIFTIKNTDNESVLYTFNKNEVFIKGNSKVFTADKIIDLLLDTMVNGKSTNPRPLPPTVNVATANTDLEKKLLSYQIPHLYQLYETIQVNNCILDASDTGVGKTYIALVLSHMLGLEPFVVCPKSVITNWMNVAKDLGVKLFGVSNYESLKSGKYYTEDCEKVVCPYLDVVVGKDNKEKKKISFDFQLPKNVIIIFDEAHRCKNHKSTTSELLNSIVKSKNKTLLLSATITDKINCFKPFGVAFGFYDSHEKFRVWMKNQMVTNEKKYRHLIKNGEDAKETLQLKIIHDNIFPNRGSRIKISELGDLFPQNQVIAKLYYCKNHEEIQKEYENIKLLFEEYKTKEKSSNCILAKLLFARMRIEQYKVPIFIDLAQEALDNGYSVVIFTCFRDTMLNLAEQLNTDCLIHGDQSIEERSGCIQDFQDNKKKCIIAMISAGSVGLSLHDIHGGHPRMSLINPSWNGVEMKQSLGRIHRAGSKSPALQRLIYCAKTYEEEICKMIDKKLDIIEKVNNGVLMQNGIDMEIVKELEGKFEILESTKGIEDKKEAKSIILCGEKNNKEYYKSALNDADEAKKKVKKMKNKPG